MPIFLQICVGLVCGIEQGGNSNIYATGLAAGEWDFSQFISLRLITLERGKNNAPLHRECQIPPQVDTCCFYLYFYLQLLNENVIHARRGENLFFIFLEGLTDSPPGS
jgi:hypothetical protein